MLDIDIRPRADQLIDIYLTDGGNHEPLLNSSQGYETHRHATELVERLFGPDTRDEQLLAIRGAIAVAASEPTDTITLVNTIRHILDGATLARRPEPAQLTIHHHNGTTETRQLR